MRLRRGNYSILFVLTSTVMMSYLAFSIDGGRMRVAQIQAENASEAASMAALLVIRNGGDRNEARDAAVAAAEEVRMQRTTVDHSDTEFVVDIDWGEWDWEQAVDADDLIARWDTQGAHAQAVGVKVHLREGITSIFGPAVAIAAGEYREKTPSRRGGDDDEVKASGKYSKFNVKGGARAAFRHRDTVVVVDVSRRADDVIDEVAAGVADFFDAVHDNHVPGDRLAFMAYAGGNWMYDLRSDPALYQIDPAIPNEGIPAVEPTFPFVRAEDEFAAAQQVVAELEPCHVGSDAWYHFYRHLQGTEDLEMLIWQTVPVNWPYYVVGKRGVGNPHNQFRLQLSDPLHASMVDLMDAWGRGNPALGCSNVSIDCTYFENLASTGAPMDDPEVCNSWKASETVYLVQDPRRRRVIDSGRRSPLECHDANWWDGQASEQVGEAEVLGVECGLPDIDPATPRYGVTGAIESPDLAYGMAGSRPGPALQRAFDLLQAQPGTAEGNIVLVTTSAPDCGAMVGAANEAACETQFGDEAVAALNAIDLSADVNLYIIGITPDGSFDDIVLSSWDGIGRGYYVRANVDRVGEALDAIASDRKIQVVQ